MLISNKKHEYTMPGNNPSLTIRSSSDFPAFHFLLSAAVMALITLFAYADTFNVPFIYDDVNNITLNRHIRMTAVTFDSIAAVSESPSPRPFANLTLALNYYFGRYDVRGYHAVNLTIHILTGLLLFLVARSTLRLCGTEDVIAPLLAAALWLVNPVHTQSVTYTVQRMSSLATLFYLLALSCYIRARITALSGQGRIPQVLLYALCLASGILGLLSKQTTATLPVMLFLYEWYFFQDRNPGWLKKQVPWIGLTALLVLVVAAPYLGTSPLDKMLTIYEKQPFTPAQRLLTEPAVVIYYISLLLFPHPDRLTLLYDFPIFSSMTTPMTALAGIMGVSVLVLAGLMLSGKHRLLSFAVFWFLGNLVIESSVLGLAIVFEHRTYLPSVFPLIALTALGVSAFRKRWPAVVIAGFLILICGFWTHQRNTVWNDTVGFWQDNVAKAPDMPEVNNNLGQALLKKGETEQAADYFKIAMKKDPDLESARVNLGVTLQRMGQSELAASLYRTILTTNPANTKARFNLAMLFKEGGHTEAAVRQLKKIIAVDPHDTSTMLNLGTILLEQQHNAQALMWFRKALTLDADDPKLLNNLGVVLHRLDRTEEAISVLRQGLTLAPHNPMLHNSLGLALLDCGRYEKAMEHFQLALAADPEMADAVNNLGLAAEKQGKTDQAIDYYRQAMGLSPAYDLARYNLANLLLKTGQPDSAISLLNDITTVSPEHQPALHRLIVALVDARAIGPATRLAEKTAAALPEEAVAHYNLACLYARQNDTDKAVNALRTAIDRGYDRWDYLCDDKDLENIHYTEYYKLLTRQCDQ